MHAHAHFDECMLHVRALAQLLADLPLCLFLVWLFLCLQVR
jgi:hypothetical protein